MLSWEIGNKVNWPSVQGFIFVCLGVGLCLTFVVVIGVRGFRLS